MMLPLAFIAFVLTSAVTSVAALCAPRRLRVSTYLLSMGRRFNDSNNVGPPHFLNNSINNSNFMKQQHSLQYRNTHQYRLMYFNSKQFDEIDKKFDGIVKKFDGIDKKIDEKQNDVYLHINKKIDKLEQNQEKSQGEMTNEFEKLENKFEKLENKFEKLQGGEITNKFEKFEKNQEKSQGEIISKFEKLEKSRNDVTFLIISTWIGTIIALLRIYLSVLNKL
jgi:hypothetical protein